MSEEMSGSSIREPVQLLFGFRGIGQSERSLMDALDHLHKFLACVGVLI